MKVVFDVGANNGASTEGYLQEKETYIYAFEPNPILFEDLQKKYENHPHYNIFQYAVADREGSMNFYLAGARDTEQPTHHIEGESNWGCSSLLPFSETVHEAWPNRPDFESFGAITVDVIRLDSFVKKHRIEQIDYLHIDAQGMDLRVIKSLGEKISIVQEGVLEAPADFSKRIYKGSHTAEEAIIFLKENGFHVSNIEKNDPEGNEVNIYFTRKHPVKPLEVSKPPQESYCQIS